MDARVNQWRPKSSTKNRGGALFLCQLYPIFGENTHGHIDKLEAQLKNEVKELFALAESADQTDIPDGMSLPEEIKRREDRLAVMAQAKTKIEARAAERYQREKAAYDEQMARRAAKQEQSDKKAGGKPPEPPQAGPKAK